MSEENENTTTTEQTTTTQNNGVDANVQTQQGAPELTPAQEEAGRTTPNPSPVNAAPSTDLNASGSVASPAVSEPADSPTTNDVEQTSEDRLADARQTAMDNYAAAQGQDRASQASSTEEEIA